MAKGKAVVAGSNSGPATTNEVIAEVSGGFPREVELVNETPSQYVVAGKFIGPHGAIRVTVHHDDEITRMKTDCSQIMSLNELYATAEVQALRVNELDANAE